MVAAVGDRFCRDFLAAFDHLLEYILERENHAPNLQNALDWNPSRLNTLMYGVFLEPISFVLAEKEKTDTAGHQAANGGSLNKTNVL
jgi:hypothetical protein